MQYQAHYDPSLEQDEFAESSEQKIQNSDVANAIPEGAMSHWMADPIWAAAAGVYPSSYIPIIGCAFFINTTIIPIFKIPKCVKNSQHGF